MNLLLDPWIPVTRTSGRRELLAPWQVSLDAKGEDPPLRVDAPRGDLEVAGLEFLIAILQTYWKPASPREWRRSFDEPPDPSVLREAMQGNEGSWRLDGPGPRAFQALDAIPGANKASIASILVNVGQANAVRNNSTAMLPDLEPRMMCGSCTALALYARQTLAPPAGGGFRASLRGSMPLATLVVGETLWETVWLNVLDATDWDSLSFGLRPSTDDRARFLWLESTPEKSVTAADVAPEAVLWPIATRCAVHFDEKSGTCDLCGDRSDLLAVAWVNLQHGTNYEPTSWPTPFSPRRKNSEGEEYTPSPAVRELTYLDWVGLAFAEDSERMRCAPVVRALLTEKSRQARSRLRLRVYGNAGKQAKILRWVDSTWPLLLCEPEHRVELERQSRLLVRGTETAGKKLFAAGKANEVELGVHQLAARTEARFLSTIDEIRSALEGGHPTNEVRDRWRRELAKRAVDLFDRAVRPGGLGADRLRRFAEARSKLVRALFGKPLAEALELSIFPKEKTRKKKAC